MQDQPVRSGSTRHCSSSRQGSILHHHFWCTMEARVKENGAEGQFIWIKKTLKSDFFGGGMAEEKGALRQTDPAQSNWTNCAFTPCECVLLKWGVKWVLGSITINTRGQRPRCPRHLSWEAGALDCLRAFLNLVLIAAAMSGDHFTSPRPLLRRPWGGTFTGRRWQFLLSFLPVITDPPDNYCLSNDENTHQSFQTLMTQSAQTALRTDEPTVEVSRAIAPPSG